MMAQSLIVHIESPVGFAEIRASPDRTVALLLDAAIKNLRLIGFQDGDVCELWRYGKQLTPADTIAGAGIKGGDRLDLVAFGSNV